MMHSNSIDAYTQLQAGRKLQPMEKLVYLLLFNHGPMTREEISAATELKLSSVCGRVKSLLDAGVIEECGKVLVRKSKQSLVKVKLQ